MHKILSASLGLVERLGTVLIPQKSHSTLHLTLRVLDHLINSLCVGQIVKAHGLQMHDVANIKAEYPVIRVEILYSKGTPRSYLKLLLIL